MALTDRELSLLTPPTAAAIGAAVSGVEELSGWTEVANSGANASVTVTHAAESGKYHVITGFEAVVSGAALANDVLVELKEDATVVWRTYLGNAAARGERVGVMFSKPLKLATNTAAALTAAAGGAAVVITVNLMGYTRTV